MQNHLEGESAQAAAGVDALGITRKKLRFQWIQAAQRVEMYGVSTRKCNVSGEVEMPLTEGSREDHPPSGGTEPHL